MGDSEALELTKRLERVERGVRRYRVALAALGLVVLAAGILKAVRTAGASGTPAVIQARQFEVVDGAGRGRAALGMHGDTVGLTLYDKAGNARASLVVVGDKVGLGLLDKAEKERARLEVRGDTVGLWLRDKAENARASLVVVGDKVGLGLLDKAEKVRASLEVGGDNVVLKLSDKAGNTRAALGNKDLKDTRTGSTEHRAASSLVLVQRKGKGLVVGAVGGTRAARGGRVGRWGLSSVPRVGIRYPTRPRRARAVDTGSQGGRAAGDTLPTPAARRTGSSWKSLTPPTWMAWDFGLGTATELGNGTVG